MTHLCRYCLVLAVAGVMPFLALWAANTQEEKKGSVVEIDGLKSAVPADWKQEEVTSKFRTHHFRVPHVADDKSDVAALCGRSRTR